MGASESALSASGSSPSPADQITTVSRRSETADPVLEKLKSLKITSPVLTTAPTEEGSLTDILVRKPSSSSVQATVNPKVLLELFSVYCDWQEEKAQKISKKQEETEDKIEVGDALAVKLLQVHALQVKLGELKGRLTEVVSNCDALCKRIAAEGPEPLRSSIKPFSVAAATWTVNHSISSEQRVNTYEPKFNA